MGNQLKTYDQIKLEKADLRIAWIMVVGVTIIVCLLLFIYVHDREFGLNLKPLTPSSRSKINDDGITGNYTKLRMTLATGGRTGLAVNIAIPYEELSQKKQIYKNLVRIENDLIVTVEQQTLYQLAVQKNYPVLKKEFLSIINNYLDKPVEKIYFEDFFILR